MRYNAALVIIGPTGVGKTTVAFEVARRTGAGEVINLDKIFTFRHFPIGSGLADTLKEKGVKRHLYEFLEPDEDIIPPVKYVEMVKNETAQILSSGGLPIIEGGSTIYGSALLDANRNAKFCCPIIGLRFPASFNLREKLSRRIDAAIEDGLIAEVKKNLTAYRNTLIMSDAHAIVPIVRHLDGIISLETAKQEIVERCMKYINLQMQTFEKYPEIVWLEHEPKIFSRTVERILAGTKKRS